MLVGLARDLPYPMILGHNWRRIYEALDATRNGQQLAVGLLGDEEDMEA